MRIKFNLILVNKTKTMCCRVRSTDIPKEVQLNLPVFYQLIQVLLHVFEDEVQNVILTNDFAKFNEVRVAQLLKRLMTK